MQWLLDTCVVSELTRKAPHARVLAWLSAHAADAALTVVSVGELQYGIERLPAGRQRNALQVWFDGLCGQYGDRILPTDEAVWRTFGRLKASVETIGRPQDDFDLLIAATAAANQLTVVTRNTRHFDDSGVRTLNPWNAD
jgi:predicted nucleic acid-binding protein